MILPFSDTNGSAPALVDAALSITHYTKEENDMNPKLQGVLTGLTLSLATLHNVGVKLGHFGSEDFILLAEQISENVLNVYAAKAAPAA